MGFQPCLTLSRSGRISTEWRKKGPQKKHSVWKELRGHKWGGIEWPTAYLVGGWTNHLSKICSSKWVNFFPKLEVKIKHIWNHHLDTQYIAQHEDGENSKMFTSDRNRNQQAVDRHKYHLETARYQKRPTQRWSELFCKVYASNQKVWLTKNV